MSVREVFIKRGAVAALALAVVIGGAAPPALAAGNWTARPTTMARAAAPPSSSWGMGPTSGSAMLVPAAIPLSSVSAATTVRYAKTTANLNLRRGAGTGHASLGIMRKGTVVARTGKTSGKWWQVRHAGKTGWAASDYLRSTAKPAAAAVRYAKTTANLNLRRGPGTGHASLGIMKKDTVVARTGAISGDWWQVRHAGKTGWASSDYLRSTAKPRPPVANTKDVRWFAGSQALYAKPTFASKRLQAFTKGIKATQLRTSGSWSYVQTPGSKGWVPTRDLSRTATRYTGSTILASSSHRWTRYASNVRTGGSTSHRSLGVVPAGEMMPLRSVRSGWSKVKTSRGTGWIKNTLLTNLATKAPPHLQPATAKMIKDVKARYGKTYGSVGTLRNGSIGHRLGVGADFMMRGWSTSSGIRNGNAIAAYLVKNRTSLDIDYIIWRDRIWLRQDGQWGPYSKGGWGRHLDSRGWNATTMHYDHLHVETLVD